MEDDLDPGSPGGIRRFLEREGVHRESRFKVAGEAVTDIKALLDVLRRELKQPEFWVFRGQANWDWGVTPKLGRPGSSDESFAFQEGSQWDGVLGVPAQNGAAIWDRAVFDDWRTEAIALIPPSLPRPATLIDWLAIGQHHGLSTRLLDWSRNPLVGTYFAIRPDDQFMDSTKDGALFALRGLRPLEPQFEEDPWTARGVRIWHPPSLVARIGRQSSVFTIHQSGELGGSLDLERYASTLWWDDLLCNDSLALAIPGAHPMGLQLVKIRIPALARASLLEELKLLGIDDFFAFPDLEGLCRAYARGRFLRPSIRQIKDG